MPSLSSAMPGCPRGVLRAVGPQTSTSLVGGKHRITGVSQERWETEVRPQPPHPVCARVNTCVWVRTYKHMGECVQSHRKVCRKERDSSHKQGREVRFLPPSARGAQGPQLPTHGQLQVRRTASLALPGKSQVDPC